VVEIPGRFLFFKAEAKNFQITQHYAKILDRKISDDIAL
jgi:hypothetical protein